MYSAVILVNRIPTCSYHVVIISEVSVPVSSATVIDGFIIGECLISFSDNDKGGAYN